MPVFQQIVNFDEVFKVLTKEPIIINKLSDISEEDKDKIRRLTQTEFSDDYVSALPQCDCGAIKGEFNIGVSCTICDTVVRNTIDENVEPILWFQCPEGIPALINPTIWSMLNNRFRKSNIGLFKWLIEPSFKPPKPVPFLDMLEAQNLPRGYIDVVNNFDSILDFFFNIKEFKVRKRSKRDHLYELLQRERGAIFSQYWPIINKSILIIEKTNVGKWMDPLIKDALNITYMLTNIDSHPSLKVRENRVVKALDKLCTFYDAFSKDIVMGKTGLIRKHVFGTRTHFSFRGVISSITEPHRHDEIYLPWGIGITVFREHILNKLLRRGYLLNDAIMLIYSSVNRYNQLLDELFTELVNESPWNGIPVIFQRNPSIMVGSAQLFRVPGIKKDPEDITISFSALCTGAPNADYDGDEMNGTILIDNDLIKEAMRIQPAANVFTLQNDPGHVSNFNNIPAPVLATAGNWMGYKIEDDPLKHSRMAELFGV